MSGINEKNIQWRYIYLMNRTKFDSHWAKHQQKFWWELNCFIPNILKLFMTIVLSFQIVASTSHLFSFFGFLHTWTIRQSPRHCPKTFISIFVHTPALACPHMTLDFMEATILTASRHEVPNVRSIWGSFDGFLLTLLAKCETFYK